MPKYQEQLVDLRSGEQSTKPRELCFINKNTKNIRSRDHYGTVCSHIQKERVIERLGKEMSSTTSTSKDSAGTSKKRRLAGSEVVFSIRTVGLTNLTADGGEATVPQIGSSGRPSNRLTQRGHPQGSSRSQARAKTTHSSNSGLLAHGEDLSTQSGQWHSSFDATRDQSAHPNNQGLPGQPDRHIFVDEPQTTSSLVEEAQSLRGAYLWSQELVRAPKLPRGPGSAIDPFNATPLCLDTKTTFLIWYFSGVWAPIAAATGHVGGGLGPSSLSPSNFHPAHLDDFSRANANSVVASTHLQCLLAASAARMKCFSPETMGSLYDNPERYMVSAIKALRTYFEDGGGVDDHMILDMWYLALAEFYTSNLSGSRIHLRQIRTFITRQGGIKQVSPYVSWLCMSADHLICSCKLAFPTFDLRTNPGLLGLSTHGDPEHHETIMAELVSELEPRVQCIVLENEHTVELLKKLEPILASVQELPTDENYTLIGDSGPVVPDEETVAILRHSMTLWLLHRFRVNCCPGRTDIRFQAVMELIGLSLNELKKSLKERDISWKHMTDHKLSQAVNAPHWLWTEIIGYIVCLDEKELEWYKQRLRRACWQTGIKDVATLVWYVSKEDWCDEYIVCALMEDARLEEFFAGTV